MFPPSRHRSQCPQKKTQINEQNNQNIYHLSWNSWRIFLGEWIKIMILVQSLNPNQSKINIELSVDNAFLVTFHLVFDRSRRNFWILMNRNILGFFVFDLLAYLLYQFLLSLIEVKFVNQLQRWLLFIQKHPVVHLVIQHIIFLEKFVECAHVVCILRFLVKFKTHCIIVETLKFGVGFEERYIHVVFGLVDIPTFLKIIFLHVPDLVAPR